MIHNVWGNPLANVGPSAIIEIDELDKCEAEEAAADAEAFGNLETIKAEPQVKPEDESNPPSDLEHIFDADSQEDEVHTPVAQRMKLDQSPSPAPNDDSQATGGAPTSNTEVTDPETDPEAFDMMTPKKKVPLPTNKNTLAQQSPGGSALSIVVNRTSGKKSPSRKRAIYGESVTEEHLPRPKKTKVGAFEEKEDPAAEPQSASPAENGSDTEATGNPQTEGQRDTPT